MSLLSRTMSRALRPTKRYRWWHAVALRNRDAFIGWNPTGSSPEVKPVGAADA